MPVALKVSGAETANNIFILKSDGGQGIGAALADAVGWRCAELLKVLDPRVSVIPLLQRFQ